MSEPICIESVDQVLLDRSIRTGMKYDFKAMELEVAGFIEMLNITSEEKDYIDSLARATGDFPIDAEDMMKNLGIIKSNSNSSDIGKSIHKANLIPKLVVADLAKEAWATAVAHDPNGILLFNNQNCKILVVQERKNNRMYDSYKYKLTIRAAHKVLMRAYNNDKFADYFSIQLQLIEKYKKYQSDYESYLKDLAMKQKDETINRLERKIDEARLRDEEQSRKIDELIGYAKHTKESLQTANDNIVDLQDTLELTRDEVLENRNRVIETHLKVVRTTKVVEEIDNLLREKSFTSTLNPSNENYVHYALVVVKRFGRDCKIVISSGQSCYIDKRKQELIADNFEVVEDKFYQANGIDYRRNVQSKVLEFIEKRMEPFNNPILLARERLYNEIEEFNKQLKEQIYKHNSDLTNAVELHNQSCLPKDRIYLTAKTIYRYKGIKIFGKLRSFERERRDYDKEIRIGRAYQLPDVPITVNSKNIYWKPNKYILYEDLLEIIHKVNIETQSSPRSDA